VSPWINGGKEDRAVEIKEIVKKLARGCAVIIFVSGVFAGMLGGASSTASAQEIQSIKPEELKKWIESKANIVVVDNQPKGAYDIEHIPGAVNFPWTAQIKAPINLPRNKLLILYCACTHEEDSTDVANQLMEFGYNNIKLLEGGWLRWVELGYPTEKK
jgi:rhodanese-related sulfurtransferase